MPKDIWVEKYRPSNLDNYVFQNPQQKAIVEVFVADKSIPHLILSGPPGTGKTTLAYILKNELDIPDSDFKVMNASDENSINDVRGQIKSFCQSMPMEDFKIVFLDEADYLSHNAQASLRSMMETYSEYVRFILTCNNPHKIIPAIKQSRCQEFIFTSFTKKDMMMAAAKVLKAEKVKLGSKELLEEFIDLAKSDMRRLINLLQQNTIDGVLQNPLSVSKSVESFIDITTLLENDKWMEARQKVLDTIGDEDWLSLYQFLYEHLHELGKFVDDEDKWKRGIVIINDHLFKHAFVAEAEINFSACMIRLSEV